jgi:hypothetical protein
VREIGVLPALRVAKHDGVRMSYQSLRANASALLQTNEKSETRRQRARPDSSGQRVPQQHAHARLHARNARFLLATLALLERTCLHATNVTITTLRDPLPASALNASSASPACPQP